MGTRTFAASLAFAAAVARLAFASVEPFDQAIDANRERSAGVLHCYEFEDVRDTPPPDGYRPFYVSHYGRHGSRYQRNEKTLNACATMEAADKAGCLTGYGKELLLRLRPLAEAHKGMYEALALRGAKEHARLAVRMHDRFRAVFSHGGKVRCQSSTFHRCLVSMANFACSLKGVEPGLDVEFATGERYMETILHKYANSAPRHARREALADAFLRETVDPGRLARQIFADTPEARKTVGSPHRFAADLFGAASAFQSLGEELGGLDIYDCFTREELLALARYWNCLWFLSMGNSEELGDDALWAVKWLADDIAGWADDAIARGGVCADLRFGHDSALLPLAGLIGLKGPGDRLLARESWMGCPLWKFMPLAANIQIVLYRNGEGDILAKVLFNERETEVDGLAPHCGPYYRWEDFRGRLKRVAADKTPPENRY